MKKCPNCQEETISETELFFSLIFPMVICCCYKCYSVIYPKQNKWIGKSSYVGYLVASTQLIAFVVMSVFVLDRIWPGFVLFLIWRILSAYLASKSELEYFR